MLAFPARLPSVLLGTLCLCLAVALAVRAEAASPQPLSGQAPLTEDLVTRFLATYPELIALGKRYESEVPRTGRAKGPFEAFSGYLKHNQARSAFQSVLHRHGFADLPSWIEVARSVALAYGYAKSGKKPSDVAAESERIMAGIRANPRFTPEQKQRMMAMLEKQMGTLGRFQPPPGNVALARKMLPEIAAVMDRK